MLTDMDLDLLTTLTALPTIAGDERRVVESVRAWVAERPGLECHADAAGNLVVSAPGVEPTLFVTAHMDHPGFVVTDDGAPQAVEFRGGVRPPYFAEAELVFFADDEVRASLVAYDPETGVGAVVPESPLPVGAIGRWYFPPADLGVWDGILHAPGCDDLAGVAAALSTIDRTHRDPATQHLAVLLTRAEEVGFVGAIAACDLGTVPRAADVVCLETSRSFDWAPIGDGPVVRVGDRISVFTPALTGRVAAVAADLGRPTQRKLMDGGACEATAFVAFGYSATCVCLPLGNYHNQGNLDHVERGGGGATPAPEWISLDDHEGLVELLVALAAADRTAGSDLGDRLRDRFESQRHLLGLPDDGPGRGS